MNRMLKTSLILSVLLLVGGIQDSSAEVIYDNGGPDGITGGDPVSDLDRFGANVADDFVLVEGANTIGLAPN